MERRSLAAEHRTRPGLGEPEQRAEPREPQAEEHRSRVARRRASCLSAEREALREAGHLEGPPRAADRPAALVLDRSQQDASVPVD